MVQTQGKLQLVFLVKEVDDSVVGRLYIRCGLCGDFINGLFFSSFCVGGRRQVVVKDKFLSGEVVRERNIFLLWRSWLCNRLIVSGFQFGYFLVLISGCEVEMGDDGGNDKYGRHKDHRTGEDFGKLAGISYRVMHDDRIKEGDEKDLDYQP